MPPSPVVIRLEIDQKSDIHIMIPSLVVSYCILISCVIDIFSVRKTLQSRISINLNGILWECVLDIQTLADPHWTMSLFILSSIQNQGIHIAVAVRNSNFHRETRKENDHTRHMMHHLMILRLGRSRSSLWPWLFCGEILLGVGRGRREHSHEMRKCSMKAVIRKYNVQYNPLPDSLKYSQRWWSNVDWRVKH